MEELLVSSLAQTDALAKLLIERGLITREEFMQKISEERATNQRLLNPTTQMNIASVVGGDTMRCFQSNRRLMSRIRAFALIVVIAFVFSSTSVYARGGGHSGGRGGGHSGRHGGHSGHKAHPAGHTGSKHGRITSGTTTRGDFTNQHRCPTTDKIWPDCTELGEKQWQAIPAEKAGNRFESRFD